MRRIVILGRGGAGKSTLAARLGAALDLPVVELDGHFWAPDLTPTPADRWAAIQHRLTSGPGVRDAIARDAGHAELHVLRGPRAVEQLLRDVA